MSALQPGAVRSSASICSGAGCAKRAGRCASSGVAAELAAADAARLPFATASFDATFAVAVLQHVRRRARWSADCARVTASGRPLVHRGARQRGPLLVQSIRRRDTRSSRTAPSSIRWSGRRGRTPIRRSGPACRACCAPAGFEMAAVQLVPGVADPCRRAGDARVGRSAGGHRRRRRGAPRARRAEESGRALAKAFERYAKEADEAGPAFLEIQNTMLVVTIAQRGPEAWTPPLPARRPAGRRPGRRG